MCKSDITLVNITFLDCSWDDGSKYRKYWPRTEEHSSVERTSCPGCSLGMLRDTACQDFIKHYVYFMYALLSIMDESVSISLHEISGTNIHLFFHSIMRRSRRGVQTPPLLQNSNLKLHYKISLPPANSNNCRTLEKILHPRMDSIILLYCHFLKPS